MNRAVPFALRRLRMQRGMLFGVLIIAALLAFELFNFSTTEFALGDLLGDLQFIGIRWASILAIAFCGIDFAGIARLFTPEQGADEPAEIWYLFGAWLLAAAMNAMLTWWGVSIAILNHETLGNAVIARETLLKVVPIFVAIMVWLIRVLIIGTFSVAGDRLFSQAEQRARNTMSPRRPQPAYRPAASANRRNPAPATSFRPAPKSAARRQQYREEPEYAPLEGAYARPEPTYHPVSMSAPDSQRRYPRR
ncbi:MAG: hypothetical protein D6755_03280 [Anaerolineae bacterium]|nr:MAG: hypothetical protein D6755_03280 [Anaerolineae bacterium]